MDCNTKLLNKVIKYGAAFNNPRKASLCDWSILEGDCSFINTSLRIEVYASVFRYKMIVPRTTPSNAENIDKFNRNAKEISIHKKEVIYM